MDSALWRYFLNRQGLSKKGGAPSGSIYGGLVASVLLPKSSRMDLAIPKSSKKSGANSEKHLWWTCCFGALLALVLVTYVGLPGGEGSCEVVVQLLLELVTGVPFVHNRRREDDNAFRHTCI